eukprot:TRINITY_DN4857_c0_g1_i2.p2 TRINITY_DN4857_c0_g1~~TRINITY_DN4857_c0_g1_i2.p2  ORF type:complete len:109 (-),score=7.62 TRINITY_DN4857_c0_g1_i2:754-1041(-)
MWGDHEGTRLVDSVVAVQTLTDRVHVCTPNQGGFLAEVRGDSRVTLPALSGYRGEIGADRFQLEYIYCGLPRERTMKEHRRRNSCPCSRRSVVFA